MTRNSADWAHVGVVQVTFTTRARREVTVTLDNSDLLALARAVEYEGQPYEATAWALLQRWAWLYPGFPKLATFIQAYAQPINPRWFPTGDLYRQSVARVQADTSLSREERESRLAEMAQRAQSRLAKARTPWERLNQRTIDVLNRVFRPGSSSTVPGAVHYAQAKGSLEATRTWADARALTVIDAGVGYSRGVNAFYGHRQGYISPNLRFTSPFD